MIEFVCAKQCLFVKRLCFILLVLRIVRSVSKHCETCLHAFVHRKILVDDKTKTEKPPANKCTWILYVVWGFLLINIPPSSKISLPSIDIDLITTQWITQRIPEIHSKLVTTPAPTKALRLNLKGKREARYDAVQKFRQNGMAPACVLICFTSFPIVLPGRSTPKTRSKLCDPPAQQNNFKSRTQIKLSLFC